ncbi:MAG: hypothetical protein HYU64_16275 [Armatimonadetes bacterium]|nr:hypothetical protein [Armatimonadota bacterium]
MPEDQDRYGLDKINYRKGADKIHLGGGLPTEGLAPVEAGAPSVPITDTVPVDLRSPWLTDRVTLSLEAQILMIEQRANARLSLVDLGYTNRITSLELRPGVFVNIEATGCYKLSYRP